MSRGTRVQIREGGSFVLDNIPDTVSRGARVHPDAAPWREHGGPVLDHGGADRDQDHRLPLPPPLPGRPRKIRLIGSYAKCRYLKKLACKGTLRQVFFLSEAPTTHYTLYNKGLCGRCFICLRPPPHPFTHCIRVFSILIHIGKGGGGGAELTREKVRGANSLQSWSTIST